MMNDPHSAEKMQQLAKLAKELVGGESGAMDLLIIEAPRGMADTPEKAMDFAKDLSGEEPAVDRALSAAEDVMEEASGEASEPEEDSPEGPLHAAVNDLIIQWTPETPEGEQYLDELKQAYEQNNHGDKEAY